MRCSLDIGRQEAHKPNFEESHFRQSRCLADETNDETNDETTDKETRTEDTRGEGKIETNDDAHAHDQDHRRGEDQDHPREDEETGMPAGATALGWTMKKPENYETLRRSIRR